MSDYNGGRIRGGETVSDKERLECDREIGRQKQVSCLRGGTHYPMREIKEGREKEERKKEGECTEVRWGRRRRERIETGMLYLVRGRSYYA